MPNYNKSNRSDTEKSKAFKYKNNEQPKNVIEKTVHS